MQCRFAHLANMFLLITGWFFNFSSLVAASEAGRYREIYPAKRDGAELPSSNNNASSPNATDSIFQKAPPACSDLKAAEFLKDIERSCAPYIEALNTCSDTVLPTQTRLQLATQFSNCSTALYLGNNTCVIPEFPEVGMLLFHFETWRRDYNNSWMYPPGPAAAVTPGGTCKQPEFLPIFNDATGVFLKKVEQTQVNTLAFGSSALPESSRLMVQKYKDSSTRAVWAMEKTPIQYLRCVAQRPLEAVGSCVSTTIHKLEWLPPGLFVYGGGNKCSSSGILIALAVVDMLIEIIHVSLEIWWLKRRPAEKHFSWIELFRAIIVGAGKPLLNAWVLSKSSLESSLMAALGIFLMTPTAAPIVSVLSGIFLGKGFGSQVLLIDTIVSMAAFVLMGTYADMLQGPRVPISIAGPDRPAGLWLVYLGLYLTTVPGFVFGALYFFSGILMQVLIFLALIFRLKVFAKVGAKIWWAWMCFFAFFLACPFLAIWEVCWKVFVKDKEREFPPLRFFRGLFAEGMHWLAWLGRYVVYWVWAGLMFTVFLGRWMFLVNVLQQAGDAFCPASLTPAVVSGMMLTLVAVAGNFALSVLGWRV